MDFVTINQQVTQDFGDTGRVLLSSSESDGHGGFTRLKKDL